MTPADVVGAARTCLGTPFHHQGRVRGVALDCAGLVVSVAQELGVDYIDQQGYSREPIDGLLKGALDDQPGIERVSKDALQAGDVLLMRFGRDPQHLAIYADPTIIHSYETVGMTCEHDLTPEWARRIVAVYRFKLSEDRGQRTEDRLVSAPEGAQIVLSSVFSPPSSENE